MESSNLFLFLASGEQNGEGFWLIDTKNVDNNILDDENLLECHRKELVGLESSKDILMAINLNLKNLKNEIKNENLILDNPTIGISYNIPLDILENIFDFWLEIYKDNTSWNTCLGLLKVKQRISLSNLIASGSVKGDSKKWAEKIEKLHSFRPNQTIKITNNRPMWH